MKGQTRVPRDPSARPSRGRTRVHPTSTPLSPALAWIATSSPKGFTVSLQALPSRNGFQTSARKPGVCPASPKLQLHPGNYSGDRSLSRPGRGAVISPAWLPSARDGIPAVCRHLHPSPPIPPRTQPGDTVGCSLSGLTEPGHSPARTLLSSSRWASAPGLWNGPDPSMSLTGLFGVCDARLEGTTHDTGVVRG